MQQPYEASPPRRLIIAPFTRQAELFMRWSGYNPRECRVVTSKEHLHGYQLNTWEVWWLDRMWPCSTHEDVDRMNDLMAYARYCGADIRRWWT